MGSPIGVSTLSRGNQMSLHGRFDNMVSAVLSPPRRYHSGPLRFIELRCVDDDSRLAVEHFGFDVVYTYGVRWTANSSTNGSSEAAIPRADLLPEHDLLLGMFSGQDWPQVHNGRISTKKMTPLSRAIRIVRAKRPEGVVFIHDSQLATNQNGQTLELIEADLTRLGYSVEHTVRPLIDLGQVVSGGKHTVMVATLGRFDTLPWDRMITARDIVETVAGIVETRLRSSSRSAAS